MTDRISDIAVLVVDDDEAALARTSEGARADFDNVQTCKSPGEAEDILEGAASPMIVLLDLEFAGSMSQSRDLVHALSKLLKTGRVAIIAYSAQSVTVHYAEQLLREGTFSFLTAPVRSVDLALSLRACAHWMRQRRELMSTFELSSKDLPPNVVGTSSRLLEAYASVLQFAKVNAGNRLLIYGETGTGKEQLAEYYHAMRRPSRRPFIKVSCARGGDPNIFRFDLFGCKGKIVPDVRERKGAVAQAEGGTLFLDDLQELPPEFGKQLLRLLENFEYEVAGESKVTKAKDLCIVASVNLLPRWLIDNKQMERQLLARFRREVSLPPLRDRTEDIPLLSQEILRQERDREAAEGIVQPIEPALSPRALQELGACGYGWRSNVRDLERLIISARARALQMGIHEISRDVLRQIAADDSLLSDLAEALDEASGADPVTQRGGSPSTGAEALSLQHAMLLAKQAHVEKVLKDQAWNVSRAARELGISRESLYNIIRELGLKRPPA